MTVNSLERLYEDACRSIVRLHPSEAHAAAAAGALLLDLRDGATRQREGVVPGALHVPRTVLEWRVAPDSAWRSPFVPIGARLILICDHGYSSALAAAVLVELGLDAADVVGGFDAWRAAGLPIREWRPRSESTLPGMGAPD